MSSSLVIKTHTIKLWRSGVSGVRTSTPTYKMQYPYQPAKLTGFCIVISNAIERVFSANNKTRYFFKKNKKTKLDTKIYQYSLTL
jgi:hypothetical protein